MSSASRESRDPSTEVWEQAVALQKERHLQVVREGGAVVVAAVHQAEGPITLDQANAQGFDYFNDLSGMPAEYVVGTGQADEQGEEITRAFPVGQMPFGD